MPRRATSARLTLPAIAAIAALALTGCSSSDTKNEVDEGPLSKYMSALWDGEEWTQEKYDEQNKQTEELVAACMQKEGFEYQPNLQNGGVVLSSDDEDGPQWGTEEFAKEFGYGLSTDPWGNESPDVSGEQEWFDPNQEYIDSLSESEQEAFYETLHGPGMTEEEMAEAEENGGAWEYNWENAGCYGAAQHTVEQEQQGAMAAYEDPEFADLFESMDSMYSVIWGENGPTHDDLVKLDSEWADCMAGKGYDYTSPMDANQKVSEELNEIYSAGWGTDEGDEYVEPSEAEAAEIQARVDAEVKKFQPYEIEVATADFACKKKLDYDKKSQKVQFDIEQQFVDQHKSELDALLAKYATKSKAQ